MANYEATRYDFDGSNLIDVEGVNTGIIIPWSSASVPSGFLTCNGAAVSRSTYAALFAVIGTSYGAGNGSTTFNVPNLTDRTCVGKSPTKSQFTTGGANTVTQTGNVPGSAGNTTLATPTIASHTHPLTYKKRGGGTTTLIYEPPNTGCITQLLIQRQREAVEVTLIQFQGILQVAQSLCYNLI